MDFANLGLILAVVVVFSAINGAETSIHVYDRETFREVGNAYILSGGSEGIVSSSGSSEAVEEEKIDDGGSFIRSFIFYLINFMRFYFF